MDADGELDTTGTFREPAELAVIGWCDALVGTGAVAPEVTARLCDRFADHEVIELTLLAATTFLLNRFCTALNLPTAPEVLARLAAEDLR